MPGFARDILGNVFDPTTGRRLYGSDSVVAARDLQQMAMRQGMPADFFFVKSAPRPPSPVMGSLADVRRARNFGQVPPPSPRPGDVIYSKLPDRLSDKVKDTSETLLQDGFSPQSPAARQAFGEITDGKIYLQRVDDQAARAREVAQTRRQGLPPQEAAERQVYDTIQFKANTMDNSMDNMRGGVISSRTDELGEVFDDLGRRGKNAVEVDETTPLMRSDGSLDGGYIVRNADQPSEAVQKKFDEIKEQGEKFIDRPNANPNEVRSVRNILLFTGTVVGTLAVMGLACLGVILWAESEKKKLKSGDNENFLPFLSYEALELPEEDLDLNIGILPLEEIQKRIETLIQMMNEGFLKPLNLILMLDQLIVQANAISLKLDEGFVDWILRLKNDIVLMEQNKAALLENRVLLSDMLVEKQQEVNQKKSYMLIILAVVMVGLVVLAIILFFL